MSELNSIGPTIWQELTNHAAFILLYFQKIKRLRFALEFYRKLIIWPSNEKRLTLVNIL